MQGVNDISYITDSDDIPSLESPSTFFLLGPKCTRSALNQISGSSVRFRHAKYAKPQGERLCGNFGSYYNNTLKIKAIGGRWVEGGKSLVKTTGSLTQIGVLEPGNTIATG